jgi:RsiW-degrading membrane proteinase PrsW (M82 family)
VNDLVRIAVSLLPVFAFLGGLVLLDSFKLVRARALAEAIVAGCAVAAACFFINRWLLDLFPPGGTAYSRYVAPAIEESLKAAFVACLVVRRRVGFLVDAAVLGFAVGAGFAFIENIHYLRALEGSNPLVWVLRGLGTAVMHGGTTAAFAVLAQGMAERRLVRRGASMARRALDLAAVFLPGLAVAYAVHSLFNHFFLSPVANTVAQLVALPALLALIFNRSETALRDWLEVGLDTDVRLLEDISTGSISATRPGQYLESLRSRFPGEVVADMLCLIRTHLELAARAKGVLLMREAGFQVRADPGIEERLAELKFLEKSIGATGRLALAPILHGTSRDLWQIYLVGKR